ncbi:NAD(P)H-binding protein [Foetidibacter luteolus]|uniref:NAD(P)H-binding protein n=1 Tax=Foetidibacter luteolus TaxID=2608880 RepID=UPI00129B89FC|nr:NAD(P)H-binding protein [Foetidibacter luteolus]
MQPLTAVVLGATGFIGEYLVNELLHDEQFASVKALVRRDVAAPHPKLQAIVIDFNNPEEMRSHIGKADCLFCCIGTTAKKVKGDEAAYRKVDFDIPVYAAQLASQAGIEAYMLVSAVGANAQSRNFYLRLKGEVEDAVSAAGIGSLGIFRPSVLLGGRKEFRLGESAGKVLMRITSFLLRGSLSKYRAIEGLTVAKAMVAAAKQHQPGTHVYLYDDMVKLAGG